MFGGQLGCASALALHQGDLAVQPADMEWLAVPEGVPLGPLFECAGHGLKTRVPSKKTAYTARPTGGGPTWHMHDANCVHNWTAACEHTQFRPQIPQRQQRDASCCSESCQACRTSDL